MQRNRGERTSRSKLAKKKSQKFGLQKLLRAIRKSAPAEGEESGSASKCACFNKSESGMTEPGKNIPLIKKLSVMSRPRKYKSVGSQKTKDPGAQDDGILLSWGEGVNPWPTGTEKKKRVQNENLSLKNERSRGLTLHKLTRRKRGLVPPGRFS